MSGASWIELEDLRAGQTWQAVGGRKVCGLCGVWEEGQRGVASSDGDEILNACLGGRRARRARSYRRCGTNETPPKKEPHNTSDAEVKMGSVSERNVPRNQRDVPSQNWMHLGGLRVRNELSGGRRAHIVERTIYIGDGGQDAHQSNRKTSEARYVYTVIHNLEVSPHNREEGETPSQHAVEGSRTEKRMIIQPSSSLSSSPPSPSSSETETENPRRAEERIWRDKFESSCVEWGGDASERGQREAEARET
ncbi:hypothetical protein C8R45DRAFT_947125 [Mycena sanguinolenta]|nr:hypothetical protein C8R45DRAFT_947125 [Mycena sanguinolenta]